MTEEGERVPDTHLRVISTPQRHRSTCVELTASNLDFLLKAHKVCTYNPPEAFNAGLQRPPLDEPQAKWRKTTDNKWYITCKYWSAENKWKSFSRTPSTNSGDQMLYNEIVKNTAAAVHNFCDEHHRQDLLDEAEQEEAEPLAAAAD